MLLPGTPSDEVADVLAAGRGDITTMFISMATRAGSIFKYVRSSSISKPAGTEVGCPLTTISSCLVCGIFLISLAVWERRPEPVTVQSLQS